MVNWWDNSHTWARRCAAFLEDCLEDCGLLVLYILALEWFVSESLYSMDFVFGLEDIEATLIFCNVIWVGIAWLVFC